MTMDQTRHWKRNLTLTVVSQFLSLAGFWFAMPFIPYYIQELGVSGTSGRNFWISTYNIVGYVTFCVSSPLWGKAADRWGRISAPGC